MNQSIHRIGTIYKDGEGWYYDDPSKGVYREPFVLGTDELIEKVCRLLGVPTLKAIEFWEGNSQEREDTHTFKSVKVGEEDGGAWYYCDRMQQRFWLCAHLFDYFNQAPEVLMVQVFI